LQPATGRNPEGRRTRELPELLQAALAGVAVFEIQVRPQRVGAAHARLRAVAAVTGRRTNIDFFSVELDGVARGPHGVTKEAPAHGLVVAGQLVADFYALVSV
jgi:hypothetical protein